MSNSSKMQYLVSISDETIEKVIQLEKTNGVGRDEVIKRAIDFLYYGETKIGLKEATTRYCIFEGRSGNQLTAKNILQDEIRANLATGWTLYGSPFCTVGTGLEWTMWTYAQAMIKEEK